MAGHSLASGVASCRHHLDSVLEVGTDLLASLAVMTVLLGFGRPVGYVLQGIEGVVRTVAESMAAAPDSEAVDPDASHSVTLKICNCDQIEIKSLKT
jgi:hypothetical protein